MSAAKPLQCPVCRARFRGSDQCDRCGTDLARLMDLVATSFALRRAARAALRVGRFDRARQLADDAEHLHATPAGLRLRRLAALLAACNAL